MGVQMGINFASLQTRGVKLVLIDIFITGEIQGSLSSPVV
ncbi:hypothetical protein SAMN05216412_104122 [Nitrosospira multiformis]|uniref:Uncharacterized protein n=1 Tax=Nitrosospira multiformis TaxID=1231 RepID=A0A1I0CVT9_9PROT|nr:hypothetical protein SAMN05216412_104122 [Nitrosospira multiformis]